MKKVCNRIQRQHLTNLHRPTIKELKIIKRMVRHESNETWTIVSKYGGREGDITASIEERKKGRRVEYRESSSSPANTPSVFLFTCMSKKMHCL